MSKVGQTDPQHIIQGAQRHYSEDKDLKRQSDGLFTRESERPPLPPTLLPSRSLTRFALTLPIQVSIIHSSGNDIKP